MGHDPRKAGTCTHFPRYLETPGTCHSATDYPPSSNPRLRWAALSLASVRSARSMNGEKGVLVNALVD